MLKIDPLDTELLLAHVLKKPREWVLANPESEVIKLKVIKFIKLVRQRERGVPLAYLTGHKEFFGLDFIVNKNVLIPRPDTEVLVEAVLAQLSTLQLSNFTTCLIDVGTGSGCIPIAIIKTLKHKNIKTIAIDITRKALNVARRNAKKHGVKIKFLQGDLLAPVIARKGSLSLRGGARATTKQSIHSQFKSSTLIITANLPYLTNKQFNSSPSIQHEPRLALVAKNNGIALYKKLLKQIKGVTCYVSHVTCFLEIDPSQSRPITRLIKSILPTTDVQIIKDLSGLDRVVKVCLTM